MTTCQWVINNSAQSFKIVKILSETYKCKPRNMTIYKDLDQFRDCAGRPKKEGFLISKDQVSFPDDPPADSPVKLGLRLNLENNL